MNIARASAVARLREAHSLLAQEWRALFAAGAHLSDVVEITEAAATIAGLVTLLDPDGPTLTLVR